MDSSLVGSVQEVGHGMNWKAVDVPCWTKRHSNHLYDLMQVTYQFGRLSRLHVFGWICFLKEDDSLFQNLEVWVANCLWMK